MAEIDDSERTLEFDEMPYFLKGVFLDDLTVETADFGPLKPKKVTLKYSVSTVDEHPLLRVTESSLEMRDDEGEMVVNIQCSFKTEFLEGKDVIDEETLVQELNSAAIKICYPYHRQMLSDLTGRMGLKSSFLPAVPDGLWRAGIHEAARVKAKS